MQTDIEITKIKITDRKRSLNNSKVAELAHSISQLGLLNPITVKAVNSHFELIAGYHRLEAFKLLKKGVIPAQLFEGDDLAAELAEIDENLKRNDLTVLEQGEHLQRRNEILEAMGHRATQKNNQYASETVSLALTTADIAAEVGLSKRAAQQRAQIARDIDDEVKDIIRDTDIADSTTQLLELARMDTETQIAVAQLITDGEAKDVKDAKRKINKDERIDKIIETNKGNKPLSGIGPFSVIYADPPWRYDHPISDSRKIENQYPTMEAEEIYSLPVQDIVSDDAIIFLWVTTPMLKKGLQVLEAWGFEYRTSMVWVKPSIGPGQWVRQRHEILLIGVRGSIPTPKDEDKHDSVLEAPRGRHSEKPDCVYDIIERMYPKLERIELFSRNKREGWEAWGNQA